MLRLRYENFRSLNALEIEILNSDRYPTHRRQCWWNRFIYKRNDEVVPKIKVPLNCHFKLMIHEKWCSPLPLYLEGQFHVMMWQVGQTKLGHPTQRPHILQFPRLTSDSHRLVIPIRADMNIHDPKIPRCPPKRCKKEKIKDIQFPQLRSAQF